MKPNVTLPLDEEILFNAIDSEERHSDDPITRSGLMPDTVNVTLMHLEMKRIIRPLPGRRYVRLV